MPGSGVPVGGVVLPPQVTEVLDVSPPGERKPSITSVPDIPSLVNTIVPLKGHTVGKRLGAQPKKVERDWPASGPDITVSTISKIPPVVVTEAFKSIVADVETGRVPPGPLMVKLSALAPLPVRTQTAIASSNFLMTHTPRVEYRVVLRVARSLPPSGSC